MCIFFKLHAVNVPLDNNKLWWQVTDTHAKGCPVSEWDADGEGTAVANTFSLFLEGFRNKLLSGRCEYVEGLGVIEKLAKNSAGSPRNNTNSRK